MTTSVHQAGPRVFRVATSITMNTIMRTQLALLRDEGLEVVCVCDDDEWAWEIRSLGIDVLPLGMGRRPNPLKAAAWGYRFFRVLRREQPDIVHLHNAFHGLLGRPIARLAGVPVVVQTIHNWWYLEPEGSARSRLYTHLERFAARFCDAILFINHDDVERAHERGIVQLQKIRFVGNGIDTRAFERRLAQATRREARERLLLEPGNLAIAMIARLEHPKDHRTLLQAFARLAATAPHARLFLAGQGLEDESVRALAASLGVGERTRFLGHTPDVTGLLRASDVLVLASHCEGFGRCLVEGMVAGLPVVGSDVTGIRDVISHEHTGLLVPPRDVDALHEALNRLAFDASIRRRLGDAGHAAALRDFDEGQPARRVVELYRDLLAGKGRG